MASDDPPLFQPTTFLDVQKFADVYRTGRVVVISIDGLDAELARRVIDFVSGLTYCDGGKITKAGKSMLRLVPRPYPPSTWPSFVEE